MYKRQMLENEIYDWLKKSSINVPEFKTFGINEDLKADNYPVVLKIASPKVIHKSDVGGVVTNLQNSDQLNKTKGIILASLLQHGIQADENDRFLVSRMYTGIELFFGILNDPVFEKVIVFGTGGTFTELFKDVCFIDSEAGEMEIKNAIAQTKIGTIFTKGFRGEKYDVTIIIDFIKKLQQLDVQELDLNPVMLSKNTLTVADARLLPITKSSVHKKMKYLADLFSPHQVAIVGVSRHPEKVGYALAKNTSTHPGVYYVNPELDILFDKKVYKSIEELPFIDTAILAIPAASIEESVQKLIGRKVKNIIIITAGFRECLLYTSDAAD